MPRESGYLGTLKTNNLFKMQGSQTVQISLHSQPERNRNIAFSSPGARTSSALYKETSLPGVSPTPVAVSPETFTNSPELAL